MEKDQQLLQVQEKVTQAKGGLLPTISGNATYFVQQQPSDPLTRSFFPSTQPTAKLSVSQPLFRGLREFAGVRQLKRLSEAQEYDKDLALIQLYTDVTQNFFNILSLEQEIRNLEAQTKLYQDRVDELKQRAKTGESSTSEVLTAQASKAVIQAQLKQTSGQRKTAREMFVYLTGLPMDTPVVAPVVPLKADAAVEEYLKAIEERPDIKSAKQRVEAFEEAVTVAKGAHLPSADFLGNYYLVRPVGVFSEIRWDFQATLNIPIFSGGITQSLVRESVSQKAQAELALSRIRRTAEQEIRSFFESYQSGLEQIAALELSKELAEKNYIVLKKDYSRGLTRNIDVLQALTQFQENKRALDRARLAAQSDFVRLQILSTVRPLPVMRK